MSGALQATFMNQRSFGAPPPGAIGSVYGGGFYAGSISTTANSVATHYLVVGPVSTAQSFLKYRSTGSGSDPSSVINGPANSATMNNATHPAAQFCEGLTIGGFTDWYMPATNELEVCYYNLKPTTEDNQTNTGTNANSVPARTSNYTIGNPAQTSATDFRDTGTEDYTAVFPNAYWSSTQSNSYDARIRRFNDGGYGGYLKTDAQNIRAIRRVAV